MSSQDRRSAPSPLRVSSRRTTVAYLLLLLTIALICVSPLTLCFKGQTYESLSQCFNTIFFYASGASALILLVGGTVAVVHSDVVQRCRDSSGFRQTMGLLYWLTLREALATGTPRGYIAASSYVDSRFASASCLP